MILIGLVVGAGIIWLVQRALISRLTEQLFASEQNLQKLITEHDALTLLQNQLTIKKQELSTEITKLTTILELERAQSERSGEQPVRHEFECTARNDAAEDERWALARAAHPRLRGAAATNRDELLTHHRLACRPAIDMVLRGRRWSHRRPINLIIIIMTEYH